MADQKRTPKEIGQNIQGAREQGLLPENDLGLAIEQAIAAERADADKWKWEYENLCLFANDSEERIHQLEKERDKIREEARRMAEYLGMVKQDTTGHSSENSEQCSCNSCIAQEALAACPISVKLLEEKK